MPKFNFPKEDFEENSMNLLIEQVKILQERGLKASEIAILIRKNSEGAAIIGAFLEASRKEENADYNLSVLSESPCFFMHLRVLTWLCWLSSCWLIRKIFFQKLHFYIFGIPG